ncbi:MAG TPA: sensor histidine kinase [Ktedonobacteraceae bacterium]|nr:sensor histidine kinase [Ktedonobacteraceae bacterium]
MRNSLFQAKQTEQSSKLVGQQSWRARIRSRWRSFVIDSILVIGGVALITVLIAVANLYPQIPTISFAYLLLVLALASLRGLYAAILASLLSFLAFDFFFFLPPYTFIVVRAEDLFTLVVFLATAIITGQLALALRHRIEEANNREHEMRLLYEQAQELAALQERQRLARELHDSVSQALYGIGLGAHTAREAIESDPEQAKESIDYVLSLAEAGLAEMRALIFELRPESLASEGLVAALARQVAVLRARYGLTVDAELGSEPDISLEMKQMLYRVAQEALHNIIKHARASEVVLRIAKREDEITLEVRDNGRGFNPAASYLGHLGLRSMLERVAKPGGTLSIESAPGQGTRIRVRVPLALSDAQC